LGGSWSRKSAPWDQVPPRALTQTSTAQQTSPSGKQVGPLIIAAVLQALEKLALKRPLDCTIPGQPYNFPHFLPLTWRKLGHVDLSRLKKVGAKGRVHPSFRNDASAYADSNRKSLKTRLNKFAVLSLESFESLEGGPDPAGMDVETRLNQSGPAPSVEGVHSRSAKGIGGKPQDLQPCSQLNTLEPRRGGH